MAAFTSDTLEHDICRLPPDTFQPQEQVAVFNLCTDTTRNMNGIVTSMHPAEGVWLFRQASLARPPPPPDRGLTNIYVRRRRGAPRGSCYGSMFGDHARCGAFPTSSPVMKSRRQQAIMAQDTPAVVRLHSIPPKAAVPYMCFDEAYFKTLESMQWNRDNGFVELIPIVVGMP